MNPSVVLPKPIGEAPADNCAQTFRHVFLEFWLRGNKGMQEYWLTELETGECRRVDRRTLERVPGVELDYVDWAIEVDGLFENGSCRVQGTESSEEET